MTANRAWKALLWKEFREIRSLVFPLVGAPALALMAASRYEAGSVPWSILRFGAGGALLGIVMMWASAKAAMERKGEEFVSGHLPLPSLVRWLFSFALPLSIAAVAGTSYGAWNAWLYKGHLAEWLMVGTLAGACSFAVTFLVTQAISEWGGRFAGALFFALNVVATTPPQITGRLEPGFLLFLVCALAGALMGQVLFTLTARAGRVRVSQAASMSVLILAVVLSGGWLAYSASKPLSSREWRFSPPRIDSRDWSKYVVPREKPGKLGWVLNYVNLRTDKRASHEFRGEVAPLDFFGEDGVYLVHLAPGDDNPRLMVWNARTGRVSEVMMVPAGKIALVPLADRPAGFVRPDGRYVLLALRSMAGQGRDLWVLDLVRKRATVAYPNGKFAFDGVRWQYDYAVLYGEGVPLTVGLARASAHPIDLVLEAGGYR